MTRQRRPHLAQAPFVVRSLLGFGAVIEHDDKHFASFDDADGARRLAAILNDVAGLAQDGHLVSSQSGYAPERIAALVAKALGGSIEFGSFRREQVEPA